MDGSSHTSVAAALSLGGLGVSTQRVQVTSARSPAAFGACCPSGDPCPQAPLSHGGTLGICFAAAVAKSLQSCLILRPHPLSLGFSRQECWSGLPFPFPGICSGLCNPLY